MVRIKLDASAKAEYLKIEKPSPELHRTFRQGNNGFYVAVRIYKNDNGLIFFSKCLSQVVIHSHVKNTVGNFIDFTRLFHVSLDALISSILAIFICNIIS